MWWYQQQSMLRYTHSGAFLLNTNEFQKISDVGNCQIFFDVIRCFIVLWFLNAYKGI